MRKLDSAAREHSSAYHSLSLLGARQDGLAPVSFPTRLVQSVYVFVNGFITIAVLALLAPVSRNPFVFRPASLRPRRSIGSLNYRIPC